MISDAHARAVSKYQKKNYDNVSFRVRKDSGWKQKVTDYSRKIGMPVSEIITKSVDQAIEAKLLEGEKDEKNI